MTGRSADVEIDARKVNAFEMQPLQSMPPTLADMQNFNTLKKLGCAILAVQCVLFFMLLAICVVAAQTQSTAADVQNRIASRLPVIEGIIDGFSTASKFIHSSMPDVARRMLTSDKRAALNSANVLAERVYSSFNSQTTLSGAQTIAQIASLVRSVTAVFRRISDVCPAGGQPLCAPRADNSLDSDIFAIPSYMVSYLQKQTNVDELRLAGQACSIFFNNMATTNLADSYKWGPVGAPMTDTWDFNTAKSVFVEIAGWCNVIGAM
jgi:hypothetical protein